MPEKAAIYLDSNAGTSLHPRVREVLLSFFERDSLILPNPSSIHSFGRLAKHWISDARENIAFSLGPKVDPEQLIFTSSGTEANQLAIRSVLEPPLVNGAKPHWITTPVEHDSVLQIVKWFRDRGGEVSFLPVTSQGEPIVETLPQLWRSGKTALVSSVWVNNETGVISNVKALASEVGARGGLLHLDAAQAWGKLPIDLEILGAHLVTFSGHKIGALAGTGVLWVRGGLPIHSLILGKQERTRRGGTENLVGIVALGAAAKELSPLEWANRVAPLRDRLQDVIGNRIPGTLVNGGKAPRVANTLNLSFSGIEGEGLVLALDLAGYALSSGSACSSGTLEPSHVLMAMGRSRSEATAAIRLSFSGLEGFFDHQGRDLLDDFVDSLEENVKRVRRAGENRG